MQVPKTGILINGVKHVHQPRLPVLRHLWRIGRHMLDLLPNSKMIEITKPPGAALDKVRICTFGVGADGQTWTSDIAPEAWLLQVTFPSRLAAILLAGRIGLQMERTAKQSGKANPIFEADK